MTCPARRHEAKTYRTRECRCPVGREAWRVYCKRHREGRAPKLRVPILGYRRKVHAMVASGWPYRTIAEHAGIDCRTLRRQMQNQHHLSILSATRINRAWAALSNEDGHSIRSIRHGKKMGWAPSWAWDGADMDDPRATPRDHLSQVIDDVLIQRVLAGTRSFRDLNTDERPVAYRAAVDAGWTGLKIQQVFRISGATYTGLKKAA